MSIILSQWFGQSLSVPLLVVDITFLAMGWMLEFRANNKTHAIGFMLFMLAFFVMCAFIVKGKSEMFCVYAIYAGGMSILMLAGGLAGIVSKFVYKKLSR